MNELIPKMNIFQSITLHIHAMLNFGRVNIAVVAAVPVFLFFFVWTSTLTLFSPIEDVHVCSY